MPKDILIRGIDDETVDYLEAYRKRGYRWQAASWSTLVCGILRDFVKEKKKREAELECERRRREEERSRDDQDDQAE